MSSEENICKQCGGILRVEWTMAFEQGIPRDIRFEPQMLENQRICPGHSMNAHTNAWEQLSADQQCAVGQLRREVADGLISLTETFRKDHPELKLTWSVTVDALLCDENLAEV